MMSVPLSWFPLATRCPLDLVKSTLIVILTLDRFIRELRQKMSVEKLVSCFRASYTHNVLYHCLLFCTCGWDSTQ